MKRYVYNRKGIFTGRVLSATKFSTYPARSTSVPPPPLQAGEWAAWRGGVWQVVTELPATPERDDKTIEIRQLKLALIDLDLFDDVLAFIGALPAKTKRRIKVELDNGGVISLRKAKKMLESVVDSATIKQVFDVGKTL